MVTIMLSITFFVYILIFLLLNILFITTTLINIPLQISWISLWFFEIIFQCSLFAVAMLSSYIKDIYLWAKDPKIKKKSDLSNESIIRHDIKILKQKRIIKQKNQIVNLLKTHGLYIDKKHRYTISSSNVENAIYALSKNFTQLSIIISNKENHEKLMEIHNIKEQHFLIQINIIDL